MIRRIIKSLLQKIPETKTVIENRNFLEKQNHVLTDKNSALIEENIKIKNEFFFQKK